MSVKRELPKTPSSRVVAFRAKHGLDQAALDALLGFTSKGRAVRRWEHENAPPYVAVLLNYLDLFGLEEALSLAPLKPMPNREVLRHRRMLGVEQNDLDRLVGLSSGGRAARRWESEEKFNLGAPTYVTLLLHYMVKFGKEEAERMAQERDLESNLRWACQAMSILNRHGFPSIPVAEKVLNTPGQSPAEWIERMKVVGRQLSDGTSHLSHPALVALKRSLEAANA